MEIVIRAAVMFVFLWLLTRAMGRSTLGELSTFDLVLYVVLGDLIQQAVTQQDYSLTGGILAVGTFALLTAALSWLQYRVPRTRPVATGRPLLVFADGRPLEEAMRRQRLALEDLLVSAREQGIRRTNEIEYAVLEADGRISFFTREGSQEGAADKPAGGG